MKKERGLVLFAFVWFGLGFCLGFLGVGFCLFFFYFFGNRTKPSNDYEIWLHFYMHIGFESLLGCFTWLNTA